MPNNRKRKSKEHRANAEAKRQREAEAAMQRKRKKKKIAIITACIAFLVVAAIIATVVIVLQNKVYYSEHLKTRNVEGSDIAIVSMEFEDYGEVILLLDSKEAPITVDNFVSLVKSGFYNGKTFHRIVKGFMIQGGDPDATGGGGLPETIKGEFTNNGVHNTMSHLKGTISMARSEAKNSASCQFFICNSDATTLDGSYAAFGYVIEGLEIIDRITNDYYKLTNRREDAPTYDMYGGTITSKDKQPVIKSAKILGSYYSKVTDTTYVTTVSPTASIADDDKCEYFYTRETVGHTLKRAVMEIKNYGTVELLLDATTAPKTVENFIKLATEGFYDGKTFHRIIEGFMIQGGDPEANGAGGSDETIVGEFSNNGHENDIQHLRGVISMARKGSTFNDSDYYDTATCQFFICHDDASHLDGNYAAFGYVIKGMTVIDNVINAYKANATGNNGVIPDVTKQPIIESVTVLI